MSPQKLDHFFSRLITLSFSALLFLTPLILTPYNYELFEFNKMLTVYFFTIIIASAWLARFILQRRFIFQRTCLDIPFLLFFIFNFLSLIFGIDRHTSLFGYYSRFNGGLISIVAYLLLYYAFVSNINKKSSMVIYQWSLVAATLVAAYGLLQHFGIDKNIWVQDVQNRVFSTMGQPNWLAAYLVMIIPIAMALAINTQAPSTKFQTNSKHQAPNSKQLIGKLKIWSLFGNWKLEIGYFLTLLFYTCLLYTKSRSGLLGFLASYLVFWTLLFLKEREKIFKSFLVFSFSFLIPALAIGTPWTPPLSQVNQKPVENQSAINNQQSTIRYGITDSGDLRKIVWKGTWKVFLSNPVLGTGPETFAYSYYWFRPVEHNLTSEWDFLYNKAHNEYLNYLACTGILGTGSYLAIIGVFIIWSLKKLQAPSTKFQTNSKHQAPNSKQFIGKLENWSLFGNWKLEIGNSTTLVALLSGYTGLLVSNFFGFSVAVTNLLFFLFPAFAFVFNQKEKPKPQKFFSFSVLQFFSLILISFTLCTLSFALSQYWLADYHFSQARSEEKTGQYSQAMQEFQTAINLNPWEPLFQVEAADNLAQLAQENRESNPEKAIEYGQKAKELTQKALTISPYNVNSLKTSARVLYRLSDFNEEFLTETLKILKLAVQLAPTDAKIHYNLGLLYGQMAELDLGIETLQNTLRMKENYLDAWYALSLFYEEKEEPDKAIQALENLLKWDPNNSKAKNKLEELQAK